MKTRVPTVALKSLAATLSPRLPVGEVYVLSQRPHAPEVAFGVPYRTSYYGLGICLQGRADLTIDLEHQTFTRHSALVMSPQAIKQWRFMSRDYRHIVVFFTRRFITARNALDPEQFNYFEHGGGVFAIGAQKSALLAAQLRELQERSDRDTPHRDQILRALIHVLLCDLDSMLIRPTVRRTAENRGQQLTAAFKRLIQGHAAAHRQVTYYARRLAITPKHLSETVPACTGRSASDWIQDAVMLEARLLLQEGVLTIAQVADALRFPDASTFGKFFKKHASKSPLSYRRTLPTPPAF